MTQSGEPEQPSPPASVPPAPVRPLAYRRVTPAARVQDVTDLYFPDKTWDLVIPLVLLMIGLFIVIGVMLQLRSGPREIAILLSSFFVFRAFIMLCTIPILSRVAGISFGL